MNESFHCAVGDACLRLFDNMRIFHIFLGVTAVWRGSSFIDKGRHNKE